MRMNHRYLLAAPALAFVLAMVPACGDDSGSNNTPATSVGSGVTTGLTGTTASSPATTAAGAVTSGS